MLDELSSVSDAQAAALAKPGESWDQARDRAYRLHRCVKQYHPCPDCNPTGLMPFGGWVDPSGRLGCYCQEESAHCHLCHLCHLGEDEKDSRT